MPRLIDYSARFAFMREAAFAIVRDRGVAQLSRRAIADELGVAPGAVRRVLDPGARLESLAADEVINQSRRRRWTWPKPRPDQGEHDHPVALLRRLLPDSNTRIDEELVWLRLMVDSPRGVPDVLVPHANERDDETRATIERALDHLDVPEAGRAGVSAQLRVVVDGLSLAVCTGRLTPEEAVELLHAHLASR